MPILDPHHDFGHPHEDSPDWSESWYFNGCSPLTGTGFFARIAIRPNDSGVDGFFCAWLPDGRTIRLSGARATGMPDANTPSIECLRAERIAPMLRWRLEGKGLGDAGSQVELALDFSALTPAIGVDASGRKGTGATGAAVTGSLGNGHFEQSGRWVGEIRVDGECFTFDGRGNRDKSWGPRRTDGGKGMRYWRWFSMNFGDDVHLGGIRVGTDTDAMQRGWLYRHGDFVSLREMTVRTVLDSDGLTQKAVQLVARDKTGATHTISGEVLRVAPLLARGHEHMAIVEALTRWTFGDLTGYGICEYAHQLDASGKPVVPIV